MWAVRISSDGRQRSGDKPCNGLVGKSGRQDDGGRPIQWLGKAKVSGRELLWKVQELLRDWCDRISIFESRWTFSLCTFFVSITKKPMCGQKRWMCVLGWFQQYGQHRRARATIYFDSQVPHQTCGSKCSSGTHSTKVRISIVLNNKMLRYLDVFVGIPLRASSSWPIVASSKLCVVRKFLGGSKGWEDCSFWVHMTCSACALQENNGNPVESMGHVARISDMKRTQQFVWTRKVFAEFSEEVEDATQCSGIRFTGETDVVLHCSPPWRGRAWHCEWESFFDWKMCQRDRKIEWLSKSIGHMVCRQ